MITDEQLTEIYNNANKIPPGKAPPISTDKIFAAMRFCIELGRNWNIIAEEQVDKKVS